MKRLSVKLFVLCAAVSIVCGCVLLSFAGEPSLRGNRLVAQNPSSEPSFSPLSLPEPEKNSNVTQGETLSNNFVPSVFDRVVITEDTTLRGRVLIKGYLVVAPQATLRIEPGTVVMFESTGIKNQDSRLVIQGRISAVGTSSSPVLLTSDRSRPSPADWGGILLVSTEKRNQMEHCRIEYAKYGIEAQFSTISLKMVSILSSSTALLTHDAVVQLSGGVFAESETGIELNDSELDAKDLTVNANSRGMQINRSAANLSNLNIKDNRQFGLMADEGRIKISAGEISGNAVGARLKGGEGQIVNTVFKNNRETALHISGARVKISRNLFEKNKQDAIRTEDGRALVWGNVFNANNGYNIYNSGSEKVVAVMNWWESTDPSEISLKIFDSVREPRFGTVQFYPWMNEKPAYVQ